MTANLPATAAHAALVKRLDELNVSGWTVGSEHDPRCSGSESACMQMCPVPVQEYLSSADVASEVLTTVLDLLGVDPDTLPAAPRTHAIDLDGVLTSFAPRSAIPATDPWETR